MRLLISMMFTASLLFGSSATAQNNGYAIGDMATDFELKNVDGSMVSLSDYPDANGYIVIFTTNHCPFAQKYEERIVALHNEYAPQGYPVIAINPNDPKIIPADDFENMQKRAENAGFTFPYLLDAGQKIYPQYGAKKTPHVFLLDENRKVQYIGAIDDNYKNPDEVEEKYVENAIQALQNGEEPDPRTTKAIGCTIKTE